MNQTSLVRPKWLKVRAKTGRHFGEVKQLLSDLQLNTVCEEARCPNIWECWDEHKTATFMILGDVCTRACRYCHVKSGKPQGPPDGQEPQKVAEAAARLGLKHVVITSVDRDDLPDYGAEHFAQVVKALRERLPGCQVELLIPDFMGSEQSLETVLATRPDVINHNTEVVPRLFRRMRSRGNYARTLKLLADVHHYRRRHQIAMHSKSGLMVGLGENFTEIAQVMDDLRQVHCDVLTIGQYLQPTPKYAPIVRYYSPEEFATLKRLALHKGFKVVESGPLVRSSYHAHQHVPLHPTF